MTEERDRVREDLEKLKKKLQASEEEMTKMRQSLQEKDRTISILEGKIEGKDAALELLRSLVGKRIREIMDSRQNKIISSQRRDGRQGKT